MGDSRLSRFSAVRVTSLAAFALVVCGAACGGGDDTSVFDAGSGNDGSTFDSGITPNEGGGFLGGDSGSTCASQLLCGASATCCNVGQECFEDQCVAACSSGVHCASTCCGAGDVCLSAACVTPT
ncbi:MAG: hypothetical protein ABI183_05070, partial [Polyangiaceae bacterium]